MPQDPKVMLQSTLFIDYLLRPTYTIAGDTLADINYLLNYHHKSYLYRTNFLNTYEISPLITVLTSL